ncbi:DUF1631 domain-containing protein [Pseudomonas sp. UL073]|uniref:DUF1631 domain-containing protein n=1 Tax=Zestomonas insulae TaxID=2809017 RepID=A0ABS2IEH7_9GAMM|nr:DUF1631 domain-containing protein [Pseudomonas insulae]MBM7061501.1 DUF1631 domain-containing protein [Pseudomonas insulae]
MNNNQDNPPPKAKPAATVASRVIQPRFGELVQNCRKLAMNRLAEHLTGVFGQVDDTLFECAEKAENNQVQTLFFDNMREIRRQRPRIERSYHQQIAQNFNDFLEGKLKDAEQPDEVSVDELTLMQNEDYEESLQVTNMVSRVKSRCAQQLFALEQRLAVLNNGHKLGEDSNPFGPQAIAQAFRDALAPSPFPLRIKTILYMLFDRHVMQSLDSMYEAMNKRLIDAGVLPNLKYSVQRRQESAKPATEAPTQAAPQESASSHPASSGAAPTMPGSATSASGTPIAGSQGQQPAAAPTPSTGGAATGPVGPPDLSAPPSSDPNVLFSGLAALLSEYRHREGDDAMLGPTRSIASFAPRGATRTYSAGDLLEALNRLQEKSAKELAQRLQHPQPVEELKADLQEQLETHSSLPGQQKLSEQEADVIDLVGMLFDFILDDENLPDICKTALSHLHTPYLKVALQDKELFTQHHHPARRLLNTMAQAGVLYGSEGDTRGLLAKMHWVIERVIQGYSGELSLFDTLHDEFTEFVATLRQKVELRERRAVEAAKGRDKLLDARQQAMDVIARSLQNREVPAIIRNFLELTWTDVLVFIQLRHGQRSVEWQRAGESAERLAWSGTPLSAEDREQLQQLRVELLENLRGGLELLGGYREDGIRRLLQDLVACQHAVQAKQPEVAARLEAKLPASPLGAMLGEDAQLLNTAPASGLSSRAQIIARELAHLEFGTWFDFIVGDQVRRLKLSWFSPTTHNYMFVDHTGQRVAIKPLTLLASEMEQGLARVVPPERNAPLVDRALTAIYRVLQRFTGRTNQPN